MARHLRLALDLRALPNEAIECRAHVGLYIFMPIHGRGRLLYLRDATRRFRLGERGRLLAGVKQSPQGRSAHEHDAYCEQDDGENRQHAGSHRPLHNCGDDASEEHRVARA
jgi:hypothetical protein